MRGNLRLLPALVAVTLLTVLAAGCGGSGKKAAPPACGQGGGCTQEELVKLVGKGTVEVTGREGDYNGPLGTGIVYNIQKGLVLTAAHVVAGTSAVKVRYGDQTTPAQILGEAPCEDIAVLRMTDPPMGLRAIRFATMSNVHAGQTVTALGYPISLQNPTEHEKLVSVSGSVSVSGTADATPDPGLPEYTSVIQHQAPVTYGNSGGPLVNRKAKLVGMNVLINPEATSQSYAVSVEHIRRFLPQLEAGKSIAYVGWALTPVTQLTSQDLKDLGWHYKSGGVGMAVMGVEPDSPAANHHFRFGDYIEDINETEIDKVQDACDILDSNRGRIIDIRGFDLYKTGKSYHEKMRVR